MEITEQIKVNQLLQEFPQLQAVLIALNPKFEKLKNPILRRTIGSVATIKQAAIVAEMAPLALVNHLREAVGQLVLEETNE